jgi:hypothetical protein
MLERERDDCDCTPRGYEAIKDLAKRLGQPGPSLLAMARSNDPFFAGSPADWLHGQWFADLWRACGYEGQREIHLRRMHYLVLSRFPDLMTADASAGELRSRASRMPILRSRGTTSKKPAQWRAHWAWWTPPPLQIIAIPP